MFFNYSELNLYLHCFFHFPFEQTLSYNNAVDQNIEEEEIRAQVLVNELNDEFVRRRSLEATAGWNHATNITDENEKIKTEIALDNAKYAKVSTHPMQI